MINQPPRQWFSGLIRQNRPQLQFRGITTNAVAPNRTDRRFRKLFEGAIPKIGANIRNAIFSQPTPSPWRPNIVGPVPGHTIPYIQPAQPTLPPITQSRPTMIPGTQYPTGLIHIPGGTSPLHIPTATIPEQTTPTMIPGTQHPTGLIQPPTQFPWQRTISQQGRSGLTSLFQDILSRIQQLMNLMGGGVR